MNKLFLVEEAYQRYINDLNKWPSEGILYVDMKMLQELNIVDAAGNELPGCEFSRSFQFVETDEKITLINDRFIVWIVPENIEGNLVTFTLVAVNSEKDLHLEVIVVSSGTYNNSHLVLKVMEKLLNDIEENEKELRSVHD